MIFSSFEYEQKREPKKYFVWKCVLVVSFNEQNILLVLAFAHSYF